MTPVEILYLVSSLLILSAGLSVVVLNPWRNINRCFVIVATLAGFSQLCILMVLRICEHVPLNQSDLLLWLRLNNALTAFLPWSFFLIKLAILEDISFGRLLGRSWQWLIASCLLAVIACSKYNIPFQSTEAANQRGSGYLVFITGAALLCAILLVDAYKQARRTQGVRRLEIWFFLINTCTAALVIFAVNATSRFLGLISLRHISVFIVAASAGLTVWALCYHRVFDARQIFAALGRRISTLVVLSGVTVGLNPTLSSQLPEPASLLVSVSLAGLLAALWDQQARLWLGLDVNNVLAAPRAQIIDWARTEPDAEKLKVRFEGFLRDWCQADFVAFHTHDPGESATPFLGQTALFAHLPRLVQTGCITPELLDRHRPDTGSQSGKELLASHQLGALIAVPRGSSAPTSLVALGRKHSLRPYTHPDLQVLLQLVELMDNILMHSRVAVHAAQIEKMESAAMMSRGLAHDLNNLATPVSTFLLHMEGQVDAGTAEAAVLADAKHSIKVMQDYIRESLFFSRRLVPEFELATSADILSSVVRLTQERAVRRRVSVSITINEQLTFRADRVLIQRLLQNLVANGIDASRPGGTVDLAAVAVDPQHLQFTVTDHGTGIPTEIMDRIFEPFFTTKDTGNDVRGLGLGLAICRKIVDLHRGKIEARTVVGQGTTMTVILPLAPVKRAKVPTAHAFEELPT